MTPRPRHRLRMRPPPALVPPRRPDRDDVVGALLDGNERFRLGRPRRSSAGLPPRPEDLERHEPMAAVLTCADARVVPAMLFDHGVGDLFVVRNAGNVADASVIGSLAFAVEVLGVEVVLVLGHERCAAVATAVLGAEGAPPELDAVLDPIRSVLDADAHAGAARVGGSGPEGVPAAIEANARGQARHLLEASPTLRRAVDDGRLLVWHGTYATLTGHVSLSPLAAADVRRPARAGRAG